MLKIDYTFVQVFKSYGERLAIDSTCFAGVLREEFSRERDDALIYFIAGGRTPLAYDLKRDGPKLRGKIYFNDLNLDNPDDTINQLGKVDKYRANKSFNGRKKLSDRDKEKIILLREKGISAIDIAEYFDVNRDTIYRVLRENKE